MMNIGKGWERRVDERIRKKNGWKNEKGEWMKEWERSMVEGMRKENGWKNEKDNCERGRRQMKRNGKEIAEQGSNSFKSSSECFPLFLTTGTRSAAEAARGCPRLPEAEIRGWWMSIVKMFAANHQSCEPFTAKAFSPPLLKKTGKELFFFAATFKFLSLWPRSINAKLP